MKQTIKADKEERVISGFFVSDNALIEYRETDNNTVRAVIRYVENSTIKEDTLYIGKLDEEVYSIDISEDKTTIAIFKKVGQQKNLVRLYDIESHSLENTEFMDIAYNKKFPTKQVTDQLVLKK